MGNLFRHLGALAAALSIVLLLKQGFDIDFVAPFQTMLDWYDGFVHLVFSVVQPFVDQLVIAINRWWGWNLHLESHWKHIFVLLAVYFFRDASATLNINRRMRAAYLFVSGLVIDLAASIGAGSVAVVNLDPTTSFRIAAIPLAAIVIYDFGKLVYYTAFERKWVSERYNEPFEFAWPYFKKNLYYPLRNLAVGVLILLVMLEIPAVRGLPNPGIVLLLSLILILTLSWLLSGWRRMKRIREPGEPWEAVRKRTGAMLVGLAMAYALGAAFAFIAVNAGLQSSLMSSIPDGGPGLLILVALVLALYWLIAKGLRARKVSV